MRAPSHWLCFQTSASAFEIQELKLMSASVCVHACSQVYPSMLRKDVTVEAPLGRPPLLLLFELNPL